MISRTSKLKIRKRGLDLSWLPLLNVFCLLVPCQLLVGRDKCGNLSIYLNAIKCFEALFYVYLIKIVVIVSAQPALAKAEKLTTRYSKSSFKIHLPFLPKPRELKAY